ncbi:hypothetical protein QBC35DRAFT_541118 [Podospora australis]|uniref:Uncharacterized protein n=1 Tax=Podospora australis TaxID=1536484 RepID=A0AAN6WLK2_9PEZI|nr:hypothetical protein QBC35DRAFT_541118 [Podospora australis]
MLLDEPNKGSGDSHDWQVVIRICAEEHSLNFFFPSNQMPNRALTLKTTLASDSSNKSCKGLNTEGVTIILPEAEPLAPNFEPSDLELSEPIMPDPTVELDTDMFGDDLTDSPLLALVLGARHGVVPYPVGFVSVDAIANTYAHEQRDHRPAEHSVTSAPKQAAVPPPMSLHPEEHTPSYSIPATSSSSLATVGHEHSPTQGFPSATIKV